MTLSSFSFRKALAPFTRSGHHRAARLMVLVGAFGMLFVASAVPGEATQPSGRSVRMKVHEIAVAAGGDYSQAGLDRAFADVTPSMLAFAERLLADEAPLVADLGAGSDASDAALERFSARAIRSLSWDAARLVNDSIPLTLQPYSPAQPFRFAGSPEDRARAVQCLSEAVYYEAAYESAEGQAAVAQVVLNRLRHPVYPKTVCGVVYQGHERPTGCQFTFTCDGALARSPVGTLWTRARDVAERALNGYVVKSVGNATHYHANYVVPYWAPSLAKVRTVGAHIFYRWSGNFGLPQAFTGRYVGGEPLRGASASAQAVAEAMAKEDAAVVARVGKVEEAPVIQIAEAAPMALTNAPAATVTAREDLKLEAPTIKMKPTPAPPPFAIRQTCQNSTLGNCMNF